MVHLLKNWTCEPVYTAAASTALPSSPYAGDHPLSLPPSVYFSFALVYSVFFLSPLTAPLFCPFRPVCSSPKQANCFTLFLLAIRSAVATPFSWTCAPQPIAPSPLPLSLQVHIVLPCFIVYRGAVSKTTARFLSVGWPPERRDDYG